MIPCAKRAGCLFEDGHMHGCMCGRARGKDEIIELLRAHIREHTVPLAEFEELKAERDASRANEARLCEAVVRIGMKPDPYFEWIHAPHMVRVDDVAFAREALAATDSLEWLRAHISGYTVPRAEFEALKLERDSLLMALKKIEIPSCAYHYCRCEAVIAYEEAQVVISRMEDSAREVAC